MPSLTRWADAFATDFNYAVRGLARERGFTALVVATLALGVGANVALFSLIERLFLERPAGIARPDELRRLYARSNWTVGSVVEIRDRFGYPHLDAMRAAIGGTARLIAYTVPDSTPIGDGDALASVRGVYAESEFFDVLGAHAVVGRVFTPEEARLGNGALVAVISDRLWRRRFGGSRDVVGKVVPLARRRFTIIGVMASDFVGPDLEHVDVWMPLSARPAPLIGGRPWYTNWRSGFPLRILARVGAGEADTRLAVAATTAYRRGEIDNVRAGPDTATVLVGPLLAARGPSIHPSAEVAISTRLIGVVAIVLVVACANVANLLLTRGLRRRREIAVRLALGVSRARLVAQLVTEGLVLSLIAAFVAAVVGTWSGGALQRLVLPANEIVAMSPNLRFLGVAIALSIGVGVAASLLPALRMSRPDLTRSLKAGARHGSTEHSRLRALLTVAQTALSLLLIVGAGLFLRSLSSLRAIDLGMDAQRVIAGSVRFATPRGYDDGSRRAEIGAGLQALAPRVSALPGVERVALSTAAPLQGYSMVRLYLDGGRPAPRLDDRDPAMISVSPGYFEAVGATLLRGRTFTNADGLGSERVVVVNETAARAFWPGKDALGQCLTIVLVTEPCARVIGVTRDTHLEDVIEQPKVGFFLPIAQPVMGWTFPAAALLVRASPQSAPRISAALRALLREQFPTADPPYVRATSAIVAKQLHAWVLGAQLFAWFGALALVVAAIGVYSVVAYATSQRMHEMGIRIALGARGRQIVGLVVREGMWPVAAGVGVGLSLSLVFVRLIAGLLHGVSPRDPTAFALAAVVLAVMGLLASGLPAWRAARADPSVALRAE